MGLIGDIYGMVRQADQDEMRKKMFEAQVAREQASYQRQKAMYEEGIRKREQVYSGINELAEIDTRIAENQTRRTILQQDSQRMVNPSERGKAELEIMLLDKENQRLDRLSRVREAQMHYQTIDAGMAKAKALDIADAVNGIRTRNDVGMATVKKKIPSGVDPDTQETIYDEVTYKAPYDQVIGGSGGSLGQSSYYSAYDPSITEQAIQTTGAIQSGNPYSVTADDSGRRADYVNSGGSMMYSNPEITAPTQTQTALTPQPDTESIRQQALNAISRAQTPEQRQKIKDRAAQMGVNIP